MGLKDTTGLEPGGLRNLSSIAIPDSGVSRWEFEQDVTDSWGSNDGTDNTSAAYTTDSAVGAYAKSFDGVDDEVVIGDVAALKASAFSVSAWVRFDSGAESEANTLFGCEDENRRGYSLLYRGDQGNGFFFTIADGSNYNDIEDTTTRQSGTYYHVVGTYDGTSARLYVDTSEVASSTVGFDAGSSNPVVMGKSNAFAANYFTGDLDDVRYYNKGLTATEVSNLNSTGSINE